MQSSTLFIALGFAFGVFLIAAIVTRLLRKTIQKEKQQVDPNSDSRDGDALATWGGIHGDHHEH